MTVHLLREIEKLKKNILFLGALVEESVQKSVKAIEGRDVAMAKKIIEDDEEIDKKEVEIEEECLKILALHQPVAKDLRFIVAVLKINNDLERIGDMAVNIAERTFSLAKYPSSFKQFNLSEMAKKASAMVHKALDSMVNMNPDLARQVGAEDDEVDEMKRQISDDVKDMIIKEPSRTEELLQYLLTARHLERIADHATNIAEDVIYMLEGEIIRHQFPKKGSYPIS
jgi:phosphate transport system protein